MTMTMTMTMTTTHEFKPGDRVTVDSPRYPGIYTVTQKLPKNYRLTHVANGTTLRCAPQFLRAVDDEVPATASDAGTLGASGGQATLIGVPYEAPLDEGTLVLLRGKAGLFVVLRVTNGARTTYSVVKLGGDHGRYFRGVDRSHLTVVKLVNETVEPVK